MNHSLFPDDNSEISCDDNLETKTLNQKIADDATKPTSPPAVRPFTVLTKSTKEKYTFKNFTSARQSTDMFATSEGSLQEKSELYDTVAYELEELKEALATLEKEQGIKTNGGTIIALVPINFITVDEKWCRGRKVDWNHVAQIVVDYNEGSLSLPKITFRKVFAANGKLQDVIISLTDGVHRTIALRELGRTHVRANVLIVDSVKDEAEIYSDENYNRRAHAKRDIYRARLAEGDERLLKIVALVEHYGLKISTHGPSRCARGEISAIQTLETLYYRYGAEVLGRVLELLNDPAYPEWHGCQEAVTADALAGWCMFIDTFERPGFIHSNMITHLMKTTTPGLIANVAESLSKQTCEELMGKPVCPGALRFTTQESRFVRSCCSIVKAIKELFKPARRPATDFSPKFKEAFDLYYDKENPNKAADILHLRRFFAKKKMPDHWFAKTNSDIVR